MEIRHGHVRQDLPDEWWEEAGMAGFVPARATYRANPAPYPVERVVEIPIDHVEPLERKLSHGIFNDSNLSAPRGSGSCPSSRASARTRPFPPSTW